MKPVWALTDNRAGHNAQTLGLAQALGVPFETLNVAYHPLAALPERLQGDSLRGLSAASRAQFAPPWPHMAIATGRRLAPVMRYIRRRSTATKLVQCLWPGRAEPFDLILVPEHDDVPEDDARILRFTGALHGLSEAALRDARITFQALFDRFPKPHLGVLIGGHSRHGKATRADLHRLLDLAELRAGGGTLFITTSRRTPAPFNAAIPARLTCPYHLHAWDSDEPNPYRAMLALCDALIVSGDSLSMLSEACYTGVPVWVADHFGSMAAKHRRACEMFYARNHAAPLRPDSNPAAFRPVRLDETARLASLVKERLKIR